MNRRQGCLHFVGAVLIALVFAGCASGRKQRLEQREKLATSSGLYCDFVNGDKFKEVEIELNLVMSKKCDSDRAMSITNYKTPAEVTGVLYCCAIKRNELKSIENNKSEMSKPDKVKFDANKEPKFDSKPQAPAANAPTAPADTASPSGAKVEPLKSSNSAPSNGQSPVDKKPSRPQDIKKGTDLEDEVVPL